MFVLIGLHQSGIAAGQSNYHNVAAYPLNFLEVSVNTLQLKHQATIKQEWKSVIHWSTHIF
jgi:hypothetical protein